jgi:hypothetical protein
MITIKRIGLIVALLALVLPRASLAQNVTAEIDANSSDIELKIGHDFPLYENTGEIGFGMSYSDDFLISNVNFVLKGQVFVPELTLGLGFKGIVGEVEIHNVDYDLRAIGFLVLGEYDFGEKFLNLPIRASASLSVAPDPLCFSDTDRYLEFSTGIYLYVVRNGAIGIIYRSFEARFDVASGKPKDSDDAVLLGFTLGF